MYKLYNEPITKASADIRLPEPRISKLLVFILGFVSTVYIHFIFGFAKIFVRGDSLYEAFENALSDKSRVIIAFRHGNGAEPQLLTWFFLYKLRAYAAKKGFRFARRPHALFIYGYEVARWGGWLARFVMPYLGAMPIHHSKIDSKGMARIYKAITEGPYPVALAPEGQVTYFTDVILRLENGTVSIGFHSARELEKNNIDIPVMILPVSVHLRYDSSGIASMEKLLRKTEKHCGFSRADCKKDSFTERLSKCREYILLLNEKRYNIQPDTSLSFNDRLSNVVYTALFTAESGLGIESHPAAGDEDFFRRLYKVRHICWDRIFIPEFESLKKTSKVLRSIADLGAGEAWFISRHQELADFCRYFIKDIPQEESALHSKIEYVQNLWDFANRTMGGAISGRKNIFPKKIIITAAPAINVSSRLAQYKENKKAAIADCVSVLESAYYDCINGINS